MWGTQLCVLSKAEVPERTNMANTKEEAEDKMAYFWKHESWLTEQPVSILYCADARSGL